MPRQRQRRRGALPTPARLTGGGAAAESQTPQAGGGTLRRRKRQRKTSGAPGAGSGSAARPAVARAAATGGVVATPRRTPPSSASGSPQRAINAVFVLQILAAVTAGVVVGVLVYEVWIGPILPTDGGGVAINGTTSTHEDQWVCTRKQMPPRVVWNRVYKCGGLALNGAMNSMAQANNFSFAVSKNYDFFSTHNSEDLRMEIAVGVTTADFPDGRLGGRPVVVSGLGAEGTHTLLYTQAMAFVDYTQWGLPQPEYINLLRHPLERFAQNFAQMQVYQAKHPEKYPCTWNATLEQCLTQRRTRTCMGKCGTRNLMTWAMCGNGRECEDPSSSSALKTALHNLQYRYAVVGLAEYLPTSLQLLESIMPGYFNGLPAAAASSASLRRSPTLPTADTATPFLTRAPLSPESRKYLIDINANDVKLYRAAKSLLRRRAKACGIPLVRTGLGRPKEAR